MIAVGIDPGKRGGVAVIEDGVLIAAHRMPKNEADAAELIMGVGVGATIIAVERVTGWIPGRRFNQNASRMFVMGWWTGGPLFAAYLANRKATRKVMAFKWQRDLGIVAKGDKDVLAEASKKFFGSIRFNKQIADAVLIAQWAWMTCENSCTNLCTNSAKSLRSQRSEKLANSNTNPQPINTMAKKAAKKAAPAPKEKVEKKAAPLDRNYILKRASKSILAVAGGDDKEKTAELKKAFSKQTKFSKLIDGLDPAQVIEGLDEFFGQFLKPATGKDAGATPEPAAA
jgi:hypothetical protein